MIIKSGPGRCSNTGPGPRHQCNGGTSTVTPSSLTPDPPATRTATVPLEITCPAWCEISAEQHAARLWANEGRCVHQASAIVADPAGKRTTDQPPRYCAPIELTLYMTTNPSGREVEPPDALIDGKESTIEQLDDLATAITNLATLHRQTPGTLST